MKGSVPRKGFRIFLGQGSYWVVRGREVRYCFSFSWNWIVFFRVSGMMLCFGSRRKITLITVTYMESFYQNLQQRQQNLPNWRGEDIHFPFLGVYGNCCVMAWTTDWAPGASTGSALGAQVKAIQLCDQEWSLALPLVDSHLRADCQ